MGLLDSSKGYVQVKQTCLPLETKHRRNKRPELNHLLQGHTSQWLKSFWTYVYFIYLFYFSGLHLLVVLWSLNSVYLGLWGKNKMKLCHYILRYEHHLIRYSWVAKCCRGKMLLFESPQNHPTSLTAGSSLYSFHITSISSHTVPHI